MATQKKVGAWGSRHGKHMVSWARRKKGGYGRSVTPGNKKGPTCQTDTLKTYYARAARAYKKPGYGAWCKKMDRLNSGSDKTA